ncbi:MAG: ORF6N domain-containing protein [bacterium]
MENSQITEGLLTPEIIRERIYIIRSRKVMLDRDLAALYGVPTKALNQAVKRNIGRFPEDFMFQLGEEEIKFSLRSQFVTLKKARGVHAKYAPLAFTEQGIAMLSSVLNSPKAIGVNIQIIRIFTRLREMIDQYRELREKVEEMEKNNEANFKEIFRVIRLLIIEEEKPKGRLGFDPDQSK